MTAHELARKLLEGPDLPVVYEQTAGYGETNYAAADKVGPITLWQCDYSGSGWSDELEEYKPRNPDLRVRSVEALRLL